MPSANIQPPMSLEQSIYAQWPKLYDDSIITFVDRNHKLIKFWDINTNSYVDSIDIRVHNYQFEWGYNIIGEDSILLAFIPTYFEYFHDSVMILIDRQKKVIGTSNFEDAPVPMLNKNKEVHKEIYEWSFYTFYHFPIIYNHKRNAVLTPLAVYGDFRTNTSIGEIGWVYLDSSKGYEKIPLSFPSNSDTELYYPTDLKYIRGGFHDDEFIFGLGYQDTLYKYNINTEKVVNGRIDFNAIDSIKPEPDFLKANEEQVYKHEYGQIYYDQSIDKYWRIARIGARKSDPPLLINNPVYSLVMFDENLHKIGEGLLPFGCSPPIIPYEDQLLVYNKFLSEKKHKIIFTKLNYVIDNIAQDSLTNILNTYRENKGFDQSITVKNYLRSITDHKNCSNYLLLPIESSCPGCVVAFSNYLLRNLNSLKNKDLAIVILADQPEIINEYLEEYQLEEQLGELIFPDVDGQYKKAMPAWVNIKLIRLNDNGEIQEDMVFDPPQFKDLYFKLRNI